MSIYFVTPGENQDGADGKYQQSESPLSEDGVVQVAFLAERLSHITFEVILSSPYEDAIETAEEIAQGVGKKVEIDDIFSEIRQPSELIGEYIDDPRSEAIRDILKEKWSYPAWHYSDEENFVEARRRAMNVLTVLSKRSEKEIVVVTHSHFLTMLFLVMALGKLVTPEEYTHFATFSQADHASISQCIYVKKKWKMLSWNDTVHLTEFTR